MRLLLLVPAAVLIGAAPTGRPLFADPMEVAARWPAMGSDSVRASSAAVAGVSGKAVEMRYAFGRVSGYAFMRRETALTKPTADSNRAARIASASTADLNVGSIAMSGPKVSGGSCHSRTGVLVVAVARRG